MMLAHPMFSKIIDFKNEMINILIIENQKFLTQLIEDIINQTNGENGDFVLSEDFIPLDMQKHLEIIIDFFNLDINNKKVLTAIYNKIKKIAYDDENYLKTENFKTEAFKYIETLINQTEYPLILDVQFDISGLLKLFDVKIEINSNTFLEKIIDYMSVLYEFLNRKCIVFVNLMSYLDISEIELLYKEIQYKKYNVLFIENSFKTKIGEYENIYIIDEDMCEIY